ncbi:MAG: CRISPR-associated protein Cas5 [Clostridium sp.]|nr:CRISPR-associated protein Cas5 [Clostridium sp.]
MNKIEIIGQQAHFKIPNSSKIQRTFNIPPISTVVGILQNIYNNSIDDFVVGYFIEYESKQYEILKIYKEINPNSRRLTDGDRFTSDLVRVENLNNVRLVIYTDISDEMELKNPLVFGKANYLAKINSISSVELSDREAYGYNQYADLQTGTGSILRVNTLTEFNDEKGRYDYKSTLVRENKKFKYDKYYDEEEEQSIFLWKYKGGEVHAC